MLITRVYCTCLKVGMNGSIRKLRLQLKSLIQNRDEVIFRTWNREHVKVFLGANQEEYGLEDESLVWLTRPLLWRANHLQRQTQERLVMGYKLPRGSTGRTESSSIFWSNHHNVSFHLPQDYIILILVTYSGCCIYIVLAISWQLFRRRNHSGGGPRGIASPAEDC